MLPFPPPQATDVAAEIKRKLEKKEKKRKKREKKLQELEANGETNGEAEVSSFFVWVAACLDLRIDPHIWSVLSVRHATSTDSEPLAGPYQWAWSLKRVKHFCINCLSKTMGHLVTIFHWPFIHVFFLKVEGEDADTPVVKKKKKSQAAEEAEAAETPTKKKKKQKAADVEETTDNGTEETQVPAKKKKRKTETLLAEEVLEAGMSEKKKKKKKKEMDEWQDFNFVCNFILYSFEASLFWSKILVNASDCVIIVYIFLYQSEENFYLWP